MDVCVGRCDGGNMWPWYCTEELVDTPGEVIPMVDIAFAALQLQCTATFSTMGCWFCHRMVSSNHSTFSHASHFSIPCQRVWPSPPVLHLTENWLCEFVSQIVSKWVGRICSNALEWMRFSSLGTCEPHEFSVENRSTESTIIPSFRSSPEKNLAIKCCEGWAFHLSDGH